MKVLYVLAHYPQNSESYVDAELAFVVGRGIQVEVWSPTSGYGDPPRLPVRRGSLKEALVAFRPDVVHVHHMTTAGYYVDQLPRGLVTVRAHSFDWDDGRARQLAAHPSIRRIFAFPHLVARVSDLEKVSPLPVAYDPTFYYRGPKDRNSVVRLSAGLPTKRLEDFVHLGNRLFAYGNFTLAVNLVVGRESSVVDPLTELNSSLGGHVLIRTNLSRADASALVRAAAVYVSTSDERSHHFGMPISIAEAQATGAFVVARSAPGVDRYLGHRISYDSVDAAEELVRLGLNLSDEERSLVADESCRNAARFRSDVVLPRLVEEWNRICLDNL
jgi:glycosyltransferase involved in cell wall biosynthesis